MTLKEVFIGAISSSEITAGRSKITTEEIMKNGGVLSIDQVDLITIDGKDVGVISSKEYPEKYYLGGKSLTKIITEWFNEFGAEETNDLLKKEPFKVVLKKVKTQKGTDFVSVDLFK